MTDGLSTDNTDQLLTCDGVLTNSPAVPPRIGIPGILTGYQWLTIKLTSEGALWLAHSYSQERYRRLVLGNDQDSQLPDTRVRRLPQLWQDCG